MRKCIKNDCQLIQYADDTMVYAAHKDENIAIQNLEKNIKNLVTYSERHRLTINADKTEFIIFCKVSTNNTMRNFEIEVKNQIIENSKSIKYLGVYLDQNLTFQNEVKNVLRKMACGIKTLY